MDNTLKELDTIKCIKEKEIEIKEEKINNMKK